MYTVLQASLPTTTCYCTENKLAERSASVKQPGQIQKDYSRSKPIIESADLTENGYPRTTTSSHPNDNVIKTLAKSQDEQQKSHDVNHDQVKPRPPAATWRFWKYLKSANHRTIQWAITNLNTWRKGAFTSHETIYGYKYRLIWTEIQSSLPAFRCLAEVKLLSRVSPAIIRNADWLVRVDLCQAKRQNLACSG